MTTTQKTDTSQVQSMAWARYPSLQGVWQPSKLHLTTNGWKTLCGRVRPRSGHESTHASDFADHRQEKGDCKRCQSAADNLAKN